MNLIYTGGNKTESINHIEKTKLYTKKIKDLIENQIELSDSDKIWETRQFVCGNLFEYFESFFNAVKSY